MAVASLVLGIISIIIGFIPFCGTIAFVPAVVGLVLGIVALVKAKKPVEVVEGVEPPKSKKGLSIAGIILSGIAVVVILFWNVVMVGLLGAAASAVGEAVESELGTSLEELSEMSEEEVNAALTDYFNQLSEELENAETIAE